MGSTAQAAFFENLKDVQRLIEVHNNIAGDAPGRKYDVEVLNKSAIVLLCAAWEAFCEDLASEVIEHYIQWSPDSQSLSKQLRKQIAKELIADADQLAIWRLADDKWRGVLRARLADLKRERDFKLNTPKTRQIDELFLEHVGFAKTSSYWVWAKRPPPSASDKLDAFVTLRGAIAHRLTSGSTVRKDVVSNYKNLIERIVAATDRALCAEALRVTGRELGWGVTGSASSATSQQSMSP